MRFGVRLPGPFFATFGRTARGQARRNLAVRAHERDILAKTAAQERARREMEADVINSARHHFGGPGIFHRAARGVIAWCLLFGRSPFHALLWAFVYVVVPIALAQIAIQWVVSSVR